MGVMQTLDYLCLRSDELDLLERLAAEEPLSLLPQGSQPRKTPSVPLPLLPNLCFSLALARERRTGPPPEGAWDCGRFSARDILMRAIALHPGAVLS